MCEPMTHEDLRALMTLPDLELGDAVRALIAEYRARWAGMCSIPGSGGLYHIKILHIRDGDEELRQFAWWLCQQVIALRGLAQKQADNPARPGGAADALEHAGRDADSRLAAEENSNG